MCLCVDNFEWGRGANSGKKAVVNKRELGIVDGIRNISINVNLTTQCIKWSSVFGMKYQAVYLQKVHTYFYTQQGGECRPSVMVSHQDVNMLDPEQEVRI